MSIVCTYMLERFNNLRPWPSLHLQRPPESLSPRVSWTATPTLCRLGRRRRRRRRRRTGETSIADSFARGAREESYAALSFSLPSPPFEPRDTTDQDEKRGGRRRRKGNLRAIAFTQVSRAKGSVLFAFPPFFFDEKKPSINGLRIELHVRKWKFSFAIWFDCSIYFVHHLHLFPSPLFFFVPSSFGIAVSSPSVHQLKE